MRKKLLIRDSFFRIFRLFSPKTQFYVPPISCLLLFSAAAITASIS